MPVQNGIGYGDFTADKQQNFRYLVGAHLKIVKAMMQKAHKLGNSWPPQEYWYFDITAGTGTCPETGDPGSPVIFADEAHRQQVRTRSFLFELDPGNCESLRGCMGGFPGWTVVPGDHKETVLPSIPDVGRSRLGLLYCDTSGTYPPFDLLRSFATVKETTRIDLLLYVSATNIKRCYGAYADRGYKRLTEELLTIPKSTWLVREPRGRHQWTFIFGSSWREMPGFPACEVHRVDGKQGQAILRRLTLRDGEDNGTATLFDVPRVPPAPSVPPSADGGSPAQPRTM